MEQENGNGRGTSGVPYTDKGNQAVMEIFGTAHDLTDRFALVHNLLLKFLEGHMLGKVIDPTDYDHFKFCSGELRMASEEAEELMDGIYGAQVVERTVIIEREGGGAMSHFD